MFYVKIYIRVAVSDNFFVHTDRFDHEIDKSLRWAQPDRMVIFRRDPSKAPLRLVPNRLAHRRSSRFLLSPSRVWQRKRYLPLALLLLLYVWIISHRWAETQRCVFGQNRFMGLFRALSRMPVSIFAPFRPLLTEIMTSELFEWPVDLPGISGSSGRDGDKPPT